MAVSALRIERDTWLDWRRQGLGGSDAAAIAGIDPWRTPMEVYLDKIGLLPPSDENEAMFWGSRLEPVIAEVFEERTGLVIARRQEMSQHPEHPWMRATLDGVVYESREDIPDSPAGLHEGKTTSSMRYSQDWDTEPPERVQLQVQHGFAVTGYEHAWVTCLVGGQQFKVYELDRDDDLIEELIALEHQFWHEHVLKGVPPPADASEQTTEALRLAYAEPQVPSVDLPAEALDLVRQRQAAKAEESAAKERAQQAENQLMSLLGDAEEGRIDGRKVVTWKRIEAERLDQKALLARYPSISRRFTTPQPYRRFFVPKNALEEVEL